MTTHDEFCACPHCERQVTDHDPLCLLHPSKYPMNRAGMCSCGLIAKVRADELDRWLKSDHLERALEQARADERERAVAEAQEKHRYEMAVRNWELAHAESVAARLVEVICEQEWTLAAYRAAIAALVNENNNVRAQIAADIGALHYPEAVFAYEVKADAARIARGDA